MEKLECLKVYGDEKSKKVIIGWGSTKGAIINALESLELNSNLDLKFIQILFLEPFSSKLVE
jgi:2-oxoglutarate ferredoxin oxidoreductase subunit alpha